ncbi:hypothetical protein GGI18_003484 [Coemansia linderi]|uniref:Uncharacterized protein n=1 Tax=Coemansia linderi TaxID=2663919 RepID=A0ACC1KBM2_9FUNG|nr:hypothetical protein GGI18_003484 [Coemansia linderi]
MISQRFYSLSLSAILLLCISAPITAAEMEPIESQAPLSHSMLGALPQRAITRSVVPQREGTVDRPVSGDISEMSVQDSPPQNLRRRWYPYGGYYPYYQYYPYGGGLDLELGLGIHI